MDLHRDACFRAFQARDARFDGRLFAGVTTTGIYCRPICPARTPKPENIEFFPSAAAAQEAGFRPCLRCRPDVAPELAAWNGTSSTVTRALRLIEADEPGGPNVDQLAERLGIGARQLRRLFAQHIGASPTAVLQTRRVHLAKQLLHDTHLPMTRIARASGFGSVRRFNEVFKDLFGRPPTALRRSRAVSPAGLPPRAITVRLPYSPPYAWDAILAFLAARAIAGVEAVDGTTYARSVSLHGRDAVIAIGPGRAGELKLSVHCSRLDFLAGVIGRVRSLFDLSADPHTINAHLRADPMLAPLIEARPGLRVAGAWSAFELAIRAILGQQITVAAARGLASQLVTACGRPLDARLARLYPGVTHVFPGPGDLTNDNLSVLRMPSARRAALGALAHAVRESPDLLTPRGSLEESVRALTELRGVGPWTAQYIAMRELREPDAFPATDIGLLRAMEALLGRTISHTEIVARAERWRPWRAYAAAHLWARLLPAEPAVSATRRAGELNEVHVA